MAPADLLVQRARELVPRERPGGDSHDRTSVATVCPAGSSTGASRAARMRARPARICAPRGDAAVRGPHRQARYALDASVTLRAPLRLADRGGARQNAQSALPGRTGDPPLMLRDNASMATRRPRRPLADPCLLRLMAPRFAPARLAALLARAGRPGRGWPRWRTTKRSTPLEGRPDAQIGSPRLVC